MSTKAQIISGDFIVASFLFLLVLGTIYYLWLSRSYDIEEGRRLNKLVDSAYLTSNIWMREGTPIYWNENNIIDIGLQNNNRLNRTKMEMLNNLGYIKIKSMLGLNEDFFLRVYDKNNQTIFEFGNLGNAKNMIRVKRVSILDGRIVFIDTIVWS